ncbi:MAG: membrane dipeptidase [Pseudomonadales bacterium]|nr:membrane dipeptidase [Pseudomonadales bacterium]
MSVAKLNLSAGKPSVCKQTLTASPIVGLGIALLLSSCALNQTHERARDIAQRHLILDTHVDVPYRTFRDPADVGLATESGEFDFPRAVSGGLNAPFMSIYTPADVDAAGDAYDFANEAIDGVETLIARHPDKFALATCASDLFGHQQAGLISFPLGMENGGPISSNFNNLEHFYKRGIRYITLSHSKSNHISDSSYDTNERWQGLSSFGKALIPEMNRLGVMVDVSHISDLAFWQVMELSKVPVIASHSSLRHFTPGFQRNMGDDMVTALAENGGVIQINFGSSFIHQAARDWGTTRIARALALKEANNLPEGHPDLIAFMENYSEEHPYPFATLDHVLDHIDRAVAIAGIDAVGIGSDYDGVGDTLPVGLKDVSTYPNLISGLLKRGYDEEEIAKILGGNTLRVWREIEAYAESQGTKTLCSAQ